MSINTRAKQYGKIFGDWNIREFIGSGSNGKTGVFRIVRSHDGWEETCALKVVNVIEEFGRREQLTEEYINSYRLEEERLCNIASAEVRMMYKLRDNANVVHYLDWQFSDWEDENQFGCDLLIRMDYMSSLEELKKQREKTFSEADVLQIGQDICIALIQCEREQIIHRDIKPGNIFVNSEKRYMLGDFGIARIVDGSQKASTRIGTLAYAAPEQFRNGKYDKCVDIYGLGLTLYEMLNKNCLPFAVTSRVQERDIQRRIMGESLPYPKCASQEFGKIILKACAYKSEDRFQSAEEFLEALRGSSDIVLQRNITDIDSATEKGNKPEPQERDFDPYGTVLASAGDSLKRQNSILLDEKAEEERIIEEPYIVANSYYEEKNFTEAVKWYKKAAEQGDIEAQYMLGMCCYDGVGIKKDYVEAVKWYRIAAERGHVDAQYNLATCYHKGIGAQQNDVQAVQWYKKAAEQNDVDAQYNLGICYDMGIGVKQNYVEAVMWYQKAAKQGDNDARKRLQELDGRI